MKAFEFQSQIAADDYLRVPAGLAEKLPRGQVVRVIILFGEAADEEEAWPRLTAEQFLAGYSAADAIYDIQG